MFKKKFKASQIRGLLEDINEVLTKAPDPVAVTIEDPERVMHRHVEHALANRFFVDAETQKGMILLSFGKGRGEAATYSPHGFVLDIVNAVDLIYKLRSVMMAAGHPDPFPPAPVVVEVGAGGGGFGDVILSGHNAGGGPGPQGMPGRGGGGAGGPAFETIPTLPEGWKVVGVGAGIGGPYLVTIRNEAGDEYQGSGWTQANATLDAIVQIGKIPL